MSPTPSPGARQLPAGVGAALLAAALFGAGTPLAKALLSNLSPWMLAGLLYLGSGVGLAAWRWARKAEAVSLPPGDWLWLAGAVLAGGVVGPVLLMVGLSGMASSGASLLLNAESVLTALLAWFVFKENVDRRIALGMLFIVAGALVLSWPGEATLAPTWHALAVLGACLAWGIDNNLTRKISLADATWVAMVKGLSAGSVNAALALAMGATLPHPGVVLASSVLGLFAYGISLTLFVVALRHLGTARTGAYFSVAPFFGAVLGVVLLGEAVTPGLLLAGTLMALGIWLHLSEQHEHWHAHEEMEHEHVHEHDEHHLHHAPADMPTGPHTHRHRHAPMSHAHAHFPDEHHRHSH